MKAASPGWTLGRPEATRGKPRTLNVSGCPGRVPAHRRRPCHPVCVLLFLGRGLAVVASDPGSPSSACGLLLRCFTNAPSSVLPDGLSASGAPDRAAPAIVSLTGVRAGVSGPLPGGSVISRLLINADPFSSEPENL